MKTLTLAAAAILSLAACGKKEDSVAASGTPAGASSRPEKLPNGEPSAIVLKHILIAYEGARNSDSKLTREEAERIAYDVLARAKAGEDFDKLMKEFSKDPGEGTYALVNTGIEPNHAAKPEEYPRNGMVPSFGDVGFRIAVNEIGLAEPDPDKSPFGWHIIKRIK